MMSPSPPARLPSSQKRPVSAQAVASLVCAAILCCPLTTLAAVILGWRALRAIRASNGALGGVRLAKSGMLLGIAATISQCISFQSLVDIVRTRTETEMLRTVHLTLEDPLAAPVEAWVAGSVTTQTIEAFVGEAQHRYGDFSHASITTPARWEAEMSGKGTVMLTLSFENGSVVAGAEFLLVPVTGEFLPLPRLNRLAIRDAAAGDLALPAMQTPATPAN